jgi:hypothetical protein
MFESKKEIVKAIEAVYAVTERLKRGDILTHEQIGKVLGLQPHEGRWDHIVGRVRRRLEVERGIATWPAHNEGYELLTVARQLELPSWRMRRVMRHLRKSRRSTEALPTKGLTNHQARLRLFMLDGVKGAQRDMRRSARALHQHLKPTGTMPRRPVLAGKAAVLVGD